MSEVKALLEDYSRKPVPNDKTVNGARVGIVIIGMSITVGAFLTGSQIGGSFGFYDASKVYLTGSLIVALIACLTGSVGAISRLSTPIIIQNCFGDLGVKVIAFLIGVTVLGWFAVTANLFGEAAQKAVLIFFGIDLSWRIYVLVGGSLMIMTTIFGFKGLDTLSLLTVPVMLVFFAYCAVISIQQSSWQTTIEAGVSTLSASIGISAIAGGGMVAATLFPDYCRYVRNYRHACLAALIGFGLGYALVMILATIPALALKEDDFVKIMTILQFGSIALFIMMFATWTTNSCNLYSGTLIFSNIFIDIKRWNVTLLLGIFGTILGLFKVVDYLIPFLIFLSIAIPPIAGIYVADFYLFKKRRYEINKPGETEAINIAGFISWVLAFAIAYAAVKEVFTLTTIPVCDSIISGFLIYTLLKKLIEHQGRHSNSSEKEC